jgi:uncharacterized protein YjbI with pentapeptide repeats
MKKKITKAELAVVLKKHKLWLMNEEGGEQANLSDTDLCDADFCYADLRSAKFYGANLRRADLRYANLRDADLCFADLYGANLYNANISYANFKDADLRGANLYCANLCYTNLCGVDLSYTDFSNAILYGANLYYTNLYHANFYRANLCKANFFHADLRNANFNGTSLNNTKNVNAPFACPEKGSFIAFKKASNYIVELLIPEDAKRCSATSRKCRCDKAKVISITTLSGEDAEINTVASNRDATFEYRVGEYVEVNNFNENRWEECSTGIHFFITRQEAVDY